MKPVPDGPAPVDLRIDLTRDSDGENGMSFLVDARLGWTEAAAGRLVVPPGLHAMVAEAERVAFGEWRGPGREPGVAAGGPWLQAREEQGREIGRLLFEALFVGEVGRLYHLALGQARASSADELRLWLRLRAGDRTAGVLHRLPWELLFDPGRSQYLALDAEPRIHLLRDLVRAERSSTVEAPARGEPLRLVAVAPRPPGWPPLELDRELASLEELEAVEMIGPPVGRFDELLERLRLEGRAQRPIHAIHFMGHGALEQGEAGLVFEPSGEGPSPDGSAGSVSAATLRAQLDGQPAPSLVVLNACRSGSTPGEPLAAVGAAFLAAGVGAVVAMRLPIGDDAALDFSQAFYRMLADGGDPVSAVCAGRLALQKRQEGALAWSTPLLLSGWRRSPWRMGAPAASGGGTGARPEHAVTGPVQARRWVVAMALAVSGALGLWQTWPWLVPEPTVSTPERIEQPTERPAATTVTVPAGESVELAGVDAWVALEFHELAGRLLPSVTGGFTDGSGFGPTAVSPGDEIPLGEDGRLGSLRILQIDPTGRSVDLLVRPPA